MSAGFTFSTSHSVGLDGCVDTGFTGGIFSLSLTDEDTACDIRGGGRFGQVVEGGVGIVVWVGIWSDEERVTATSGWSWTVVC